MGIITKMMVTKSGVLGLIIGLIVVFTAISLAGSTESSNKISNISKDNENSLSQNEIPKNCSVWYDGCNTCKINPENPEIMMCTEMACLEYGKSMCTEFDTQ
jgi:hypothetical protein